MRMADDFPACAGTGHGCGATRATGTGDLSSSTARTSGASSGFLAASSSAARSAVSLVDRASASRARPASVTSVQMPRRSVSQRYRVSSPRSSSRVTRRVVALWLRTTATGDLLHLKMAAWAAVLPAQDVEEGVLPHAEPVPALQSPLDTGLDPPVEQGERAPALGQGGQCGGLGFAIVPPLQKRVLDQTSGAPTLASAVTIGAFNLGNALSARLGGLVIAAGLGSPRPTGSAPFRPLPPWFSRSSPVLWNIARSPGADLSPGTVRNRSRHPRPTTDALTPTRHRIAPHHEVTP